MPSTQVSGMPNAILSLQKLVLYLQNSNGLTQHLRCPSFSKCWGRQSSEMLHIGSTAMYWRPLIWITFLCLEMELRLVVSFCTSKWLNQFTELEKYLLLNAPLGKLTGLKKAAFVERQPVSEGVVIPSQVEIKKPKGKTPFIVHACLQISSPLLPVLQVK